MIGWALTSPGECGQAGSEEVKLVSHNSQEMSQKHESVLTYLWREEKQNKCTHIFQNKCTVSINYHYQQYFIMSTRGQA